MFINKRQWICIFLIFVFGFFQFLNANIKVIDSLLVKAEKNIPGNPSKCIFYCLKADSIASIKGLTDYEAKSAFIKGRAYLIIGNNNKASGLFNFSLSSYSKNKDNIGIAKSQNQLGIISRFFGMFESALKFHYDALKIYQSINDAENIASTLNFIGLVYRNLNDSENALNFYQQALTIVSGTNNELIKSDILNNLGSFYWYNGNYEKALNFYKKSLKIREHFPEYSDKIAGSLNNIGNVYRKINNTDEAIKYYDKSIYTSLSLGDKNLYSVTLKNKGILYLNLGKLATAENYFKKSLKISENANLKRVVKENLLNLSKLYTLKKDYKLALEAHEQYYKIRDSLLNEKVHNVITDLKVKSEAERKKKEIQALESEKQKNLKNLLIVISLIVLLLALLLYRTNLNKTRSNKLLRVKNLEIIEKNKLLNSLNFKIEESEQTYRYLFENNALPMLIYYNESMEIAAVNSKSVELYGYSIDEFKEMYFNDIQIEWDFKKESTMINYMQQMIGEKCISKHVKKNGTVFYAEITSYPINFNGQNGTHVLIHDISDRLYAEMTIKESEEKFYNLFESTPDALLLLEEKSFKITDANNAAAILLNREKEHLIGRNYNKLGLPDINEIIKNQKNEIDTNTSQADEYIVKQEKGENIPVEISLQNYNVGEKTVCMVICRDIRKRKKLEEQLHQSQKLEAIGQLAGGIAHDFNNLLTIIRGYSELLLLKTKKDDKNFGKIEQIDIAAQRAEALTRQLLAFSRKQIQTISIVNLNKIIINMEKMIHRLIHENIEFVTELDENIGNINADSGQIEQIVLNLIVNARDAMPNGGKISIKSKETFLNIGDIIPGRTDNDYFVEFSVKDTGIGMDQETQSRIFEPFFTTKEKHRGTGLGLSTVYGIIKQSKGYITVNSKINEGAEFKVFLPKVFEEVESKLKVEEAFLKTEGFETILVVEDEDEVRQIACEILKEKKYNVLEATEGKQAIKIFKKNKIHLVLTDVVMPKMGGKELADQIKKINPEIPIVFMSGYTNGAIAKDSILDSKIKFIQKPFTPIALVEIIRNILDKTKNN